MGKIINVDFQKKKLEYTWHDDREKRIQETEDLKKVLKVVLEKIVYLTDDDLEFQTYCAKALGGIVFNLTGRL